MFNRLLFVFMENNVNIQKKLFIQVIEQINEFQDRVFIDLDYGIF